MNDDKGELQRNDYIFHMFTVETWKSGMVLVMFLISILKLYAIRDIALIIVEFRLNGNDSERNT